MNLLTKTTPWVAASLLAVASCAFGQQDKGRPQQRSYDQNHEMMQMMPGYDAPARIEVRGSWDFYATGAFTYWQPIQENMELGIVTNTAALTNVTHSELNGDVVNLDFEFKPGFQVGLGMNFNHDSWDAYALYTWFRGSHNTSTSISTSATQEGIVPFFGHPVVINGGSNIFSEGSEHWKCNMDLVDLELARCYYVGNQLTFRPSFGARGSWIRQHMNAKYINTLFSGATGVYTGVLGTLNSIQKSYCWGVGPRVALQSNWMIGEGFRFYGNGAGDILYTRYTKLSEFDTFTNASNAAVAEQAYVHQADFGCLRPHMELELGFGWGSYFDNNNWHFDWMAGYNFQVFFNQNMFRKYDSTASRGTSTAVNGDLFIQGLTTTMRFDF